MTATARKAAGRTGSHPAENGGFTVNEVLTGKRQIETPEFAAMVRRVVRALNRRVANGDVEGLRTLVGLTEFIQGMVAATVLELHERHGYTWEQIGRSMGMTRQAAQQRWGSK